MIFLGAQGFGRGQNILQMQDVHLESPGNWDQIDKQRDGI